MRALAIPLAFLFLATCGACRRSEPTVATLTPVAGTAPNTQIIPVTPSPAGSARATPETAFPTSPIPQVTGTDTALPGSISPEDILVREISPENAARLSLKNEYFFGAWKQVLAIAWSPDGESLAVSAGDEIYILDTTLLTVTLVLEPGVAMPGLAYSPDGLQLAAGDRNGMLYVWNARSGQLVADLQAHQKSISSLAFSPDGRLLATAGYDALARLWDAGSLAGVSEMIGGTFAIPAIAFTPDGNSLAIVNGNVIRLRDVETTRFVRTLVGATSFYTLDISPEGQYLASGDVNNTVQIWDLTAEAGPGGEIRQSLLTFDGHTGRINRPEALVWQVAYSPDGTVLASAGGDEVVRLWESATGSPLAVLTGHSRAVTSVAFSSDGTGLASGSLDGRLILWEVMPPTEASAQE